MENIVKVIQDFDGFFEAEAKRIAAELPQKGIIIEVEAGPYKDFDVKYGINDENTHIHLIYYSAIRAGFGKLWHRQLVAELNSKLNNNN